MPITDNDLVAVVSGNAATVPAFTYTNPDPV